MRERVTALFSPKVRKCLHRSTLLQKEWVVITLLSIWGLFVYYHHQGTALRGDEGMYAAIARRITLTGEWFHLEYEGRPYFNKPPLLFWQIALSMLVWGPTEFAVRFPSATFGIATMFLVYYSGKVLFNRRVGLAAALITATTTASVFYAHQGNFDIQLGFWMNVAIFASYLAYRGGERRLGYLCLAFLSMAVGTMLKGPVAIILAGVVALAILVITRTSQVVREVPFLVAGLLVFLLITGTYYWKLGEPFNQYFFVHENLARIYHWNTIVDEKLADIYRWHMPPYWYLPRIFPEFFPWSLFLPCVALHLWISRSSHSSEEDLLILTWCIGFLALLSLIAAKSDRFLVYLIPPFALLIARYWDHLWSGPEGARPVEHRMLRVTAAILVLVTLGVLYVGSSVLYRRFGIPTDFYYSVPFALLIASVVVGCLGVLYSVWRGRPRAILVSVLILAVMVTLVHVQFFYPARARYDSSGSISREDWAIVGQSPCVVAATGVTWADRGRGAIDSSGPPC